MGLILCLRALIVTPAWGLMECEGGPVLWVMVITCITLLLTLGILPANSLIIRVVLVWEIKSRGF